MHRPRAIVIEDQPIIWDYIKSCLKDLCEIEAFCSNTKEAEVAIKKYNPTLVWLDCYLGEFSDDGQGIKNSGLQIAFWIKKHFPDTKIFLFTASNEISILKQSENLGIEGIALSGKYIKDKKTIRNGVRKILKGDTWVSPQAIENVELEKFKKVTVFELSVLSALICGLNTNQIAEQLSCSRKQINNAIYRAQQKLFIGPELNRNDFLDLLKRKILKSLDISKYYNLTEIVSVNSFVENCLEPIMKNLKDESLVKRRLNFEKEHSR